MMPAPAGCKPIQDCQLQALQPQNREAQTVAPADAAALDAISFEIGQRRAKKVAIGIGRQPVCKTLSPRASTHQTTALATTGVPRRRRTRAPCSTALPLRA